MALQRITLTGTLAADTYRSLADLFGFIGAQAVIIEGFIQAQTQGATLKIVPRGGAAPATADAGLALSAGTAIGLGPTSVQAGTRMDEVWVRNSTAGSNATLVFLGVLEVS